MLLYTVMLITDSYQVKIMKEIENIGTNYFKTK